MTPGIRHAANAMSFMMMTATKESTIVTLVQYTTLTNTANKNGQDSLPCLCLLKCTMIIHQEDPRKGRSKETKIRKQARYICKQIMTNLAIA